jgi:hypothetical protein
VKANANAARRVGVMGNIVNDREVSSEDRIYMQIVGVFRQVAVSVCLTTRSSFDMALQFKFLALHEPT